MERNSMQGGGWIEFEVRRKSLMVGFPRGGWCCWWAPMAARETGETKTLFVFSFFLDLVLGVW
jgi:hypothetical protein